MYARFNSDSQVKGETTGLFNIWKPLSGFYDFYFSVFVF